MNGSSIVSNGLGVTAESSATTAGVISAIDGGYIAVVGAGNANSVIQTLPAGLEGQEVTLVAEDVSATGTIEITGAGNIVIKGALAMDADQDSATFRYNGTAWIEIARSLS